MLALLTALLSLLATASSLHRRDFPPTAPITGDISGHIHDPSVIRRDDGKYFLFTTNDKINIATAPSMNGPWKHVGFVLPRGSKIARPGLDDHWAPDIFKADGTYYLYYSVSSFGSKASDIGVATSTSIDPGTWTDHGSIGIPSSPRCNRIDPNLFRQHPDPESPYLMTFGSFWEQIFQIPMADPPLTVAHDAAVTHLEHNATSTATEGSYLFWLPVQGREWFYLFFSSGACCNTPNKLASAGDEYKILVCRSTRPDGGFADADGNDCLAEGGGTLVLGSHGDVYAPGGQGVFYDAGQEIMVLYYHYVKPSKGFGYDGFFFGWNRLGFESGWPVVVGVEGEGAESAAETMEVTRTKTGTEGTKTGGAVGLEGIMGLAGWGLVGCVCVALW